MTEMSWERGAAICAVLLAVWLVLRWKRFLIESLIAKKGIRQILLDRGKVDAINKASTIIILIIAGLILLGITNNNINAIIAFGGVGGIALAFASQQIIANFFGGIMIYLTQPFMVGDTIFLPNPSIEGSVEEIGWYTTRILSTDKRPIYIPNALFSTLIVTTLSRMSHRQIKENLYISSDDLAVNMEKVKALLLTLKRMMQAAPDLDRELPIFAHLTSLNASSFEVQLIAYTKRIDSDGYLTIRENLLINASELVQKQGLQFAQRYYG